MNWMNWIIIHKMFTGKNGFLDWRNCRVIHLHIWNFRWDFFTNLCFRKYLKFLSRIEPNQPLLITLYFFLRNFRRIDTDLIDIDFKLNKVNQEFVPKCSKWLNLNCRTFESFNFDVKQSSKMKLDKSAPIHNFFFTFTLPFHWIAFIINLNYVLRIGYLQIFLLNELT